MYTTVYKYIHKYFSMLQTLQNLSYFSTCTYNIAVSVSWSSFPWHLIAEHRLLFLGLPNQSRIKALCILRREPTKSIQMTCGYVHLTRILSWQWIWSLKSRNIKTDNQPADSSIYSNKELIHNTAEMWSPSAACLSWCVCLFPW